MHAPPEEPSLLRALPLAARGILHIGRTPALWPWVAAPAAVFGVLAAVFLWVGWGWASDLVTTLLGPPGGSGLRNGLRAVASVAAHIALVFGSMIGAWYTTAALTGPFHDRLSSLVETAELGTPADPPMSVAMIVSDILTGAIHTLAALTMWATAACLLLPLQLIPIAGEVAYAVLGTSLSALMVAWQSLDYPLSRRRMPLSAKLALMREHRGASLGLGLGTLALLAIPVLNLLAMPAAVVGATRLTCDLTRLGRAPSPPV
jgi:CysZ protein